MGKKSLVKSTEKKSEDAPKKAAAEAEDQSAEKKAVKKAAPKKAAAKKAPAKKTTAKKTTAKKAAPKKAAAKKEAPAKKDEAKPAKKEEPKTPEKEAKAPDKAPEPPKAPEKAPEPVKAAAPAPKEEKKEPPKISDLLKKKFAPLGTLPKPVSIPATKPEGSDGSSAAPFADREILFKKFDMAEIMKAAKWPEPPEPAEEPEKIMEAAEAPAPGPLSAKAPEEPTLEDLEPGVLKRATEYSDKVFDGMEKALFTGLGVLNEAVYDMKRRKAKADPKKARTGLGFGIVAFALVIFLLLATSYSNAGRFYFVAEEDGYALLRGRFAPVGKTRVDFFPGMEFVEPPQAVYSIEDAYRIAKTHYVLKAEHELTLEVPDYEAARESMKKALGYTLGVKERSALQARLNRLDFVKLVAQAQGAVVDDALYKLTDAQEMLNRAAALANTPEEKELVAQEQARLDKAMEALGNQD